MSDKWTKLNQRARMERHTVQAGLVQHDGKNQVYTVHTRSAPAGTYYNVRIRKTDSHRTVRITCTQVNPLGQGRCPGNTYNGTVCRHVLAALTAHYSVYQLKFYSTESGAQKAGNPIRVVSGDGSGQIWIVGRKKGKGK